MAVSKSRRVSGWILIGLLVISIIVCALFFLGGTNSTDVEGYKSYNNTSLLLFWMYFQIVVTLLTTLVFALLGFFRALKRNPKNALRGLLGFAGLIVLLVVTYAIGNGDPESLHMLSDDSNSYLTPFWLKTTDMVIYTSIVLLVLNVVVLFFGAIRSTILKRSRK